MAGFPREVFFEVMRNSFRVTFKEVCDAILSNELIGGLSAKERGRDAARRNREFIHVPPGNDDTCWQICEPRDYVTNLYNLLESTLGKQEVIPRIIDVLSGSGADALRMSLDACGLDGSIYSNLVNYVLDGAQSDRTTALLLLHLFVSTAISGNPDESARELIDTAHSLKFDNMTTATPPVQDCEIPSVEKERFALMRICGTALFPSRTYPLSCEPEGTEVGSILLTSSCITDVERGVSRTHLHIWRDEDGTWWCKGLLSLNGTTLFDKINDTLTVIEPPRDERAPDYEPKAFPLKLGDIITLGGTTEFIVVSVGA